MYYTRDGEEGFNPLARISVFPTETDPRVQWNDWMCFNPLARISVFPTRLKETKMPPAQVKSQSPCED